MEKLLRTDDVLKIIPLDRSTLFRLVRQGLFPATTIQHARNQTYLFKRAHVLDWINKNGNKAFRECEGMLEK